MEAKTVVLTLCACLTAISGNAQPPQRFQARKFLDMLGQTFDPQVAYLDLLTALHERLNLDPIGNVTTGSSAADSGITNPNAMAESATNCPVAPAERGASITYTSDTRVLGSRAFYQCEKGYDGKSVFIQCLQGGKWSSFSGWTGCTPADCGAPPPSVTYADPSYTTTTYGSVVLYTCQPGYKMDKPNANVTCLDTSFWDTPAFTCEKIATGSQNPMPFGSLFNGGGGNTAATTNQNPMMAALLNNMPGMQGMPGLSLPGSNQGSAPSNNNNNPMMAMFSQMFPNMATPAPPTTPKPVTSNPGMPSGFQLPSHLQSLLPNGISNSAGIKPQDLMTLTSLGLGSGTSAGAPRDITQLLGSMNPMSIFGGAMGMPSPGQIGTAGAAGATPGAPADPEKMAEQREEMMMRAAMASAMRSMMGGGHAQQGQGQANTTTTSSRNPAMEMMTLMALQSGLSGGAAGAGGASGSGGMDPLAMMFGGMSPAMLMGGGGGSGGSGGGLFGSLFGGA